MKAKKNNVRCENPAMMEQLEDRELYAVSLTPTIPIPPPSSNTVSRLVVVQPTVAPVQTNLVVIAIISVLIG